MNLSKRITGLGLAVAMMLGGFNLLADPPTGTYMVEFSDPAVRIWDPTGNYNESFDTGDDWDVAYTLNVDGGGNLTGSGTFSVDSCALGACIDLSGDFIITGKMSGKGDTTRIKMNFDMSGEGIFQGFDLFFTAKMKVNAEINTATSQMMGTINGSVKVKIPGEGSGGASVPKSEFYAGLPAGSDGVWILVLNLNQPVPEKPEQLAGNATIELSSGLTLALDAVKGKYKEKTDETKIGVKGTKEQVESKGIKLKIETLPGGGLDLKKMKAKIAKQKVGIDTTKEFRSAGSESSGSTITSSGSSLEVIRFSGPNLPLPPTPYSPPPPPSP